MTTEQQQSDRDFERQALYNQYVAYTKSAARMLLLIIVIGVLMGYKALDRYFVVENDLNKWQKSQRAYFDSRMDWSHSTHILLEELIEVKNAELDALLVAIQTPGDSTEWRRLRYSARTWRDSGNVLQNEAESLQGLLSLDLPKYDPPDFDGELKLPLVGIDLPTRVFLYVMPPFLMLFIMGFWIFLRSSFTSFRQLLGSVSDITDKSTIQWPWLYNLPLLSLPAKLFWQGVLEFLPLPIWLTTAIAYIYGVSGFYGFIMLYCLGLLPLIHNAIMQMPSFNYIAYFRRRYRELKVLEHGPEPPPNSLLPSKD